MTIPNIPLADELHAIREEIKTLEAREAAVKAILISDPETRTGNRYIAEVKTTKRLTVDIKELRACHSEIVEQFAFSLDTTRITLLQITEDGELLPAKRRGHGMTPHRDSSQRDSSPHAASQLNARAATGDSQ